MTIEINKEELYTQKRFDAALGTAKTFMSNFHQLQVPLIDMGFEYWNSEGLYMSLRTEDINEKMMIAKESIKGGSASKKFRKIFALEQNEQKRARYMLHVVREKFTRNPDLAQLLMETGSTEIIEKNYWGDTLFGVSDKTLKGANILGKCLMIVREELKL